MELPFDPHIDFRVVLESMTESVLITSTELDLPGPYIIYVNPAFEKMTGWPGEEIIGKNPRILQGERTDFGIFHDMREKLGQGKIWRGRTLNYKKDGTAFFMQWSIVPVKDEKGKVYQYLAVQTDVSHIVSIETKLTLARQEEQKQLLEIEEKNKTLNRLIKEQRKTLDIFGKYVPAPIVEKALSHKKGELNEGEQLEVALLFCDIRRFTTIAEGLNPKETVHLLNVYYSKMSEAIEQNNGVINQFVGDEIFISFGAPLPIPNPEISSVKCALEMIRKLTEINAILKDLIDIDIVVGIGIHFGPVIAGNLGSDNRLSYSITGDAVNTAKRIESLTRDLPNAILISRPINAKVQSIVKTVSLGEIPIKGKNQRVTVYEVLS